MRNKREEQQVGRLEKQQPRKILIGLKHQDQYLRKKKHAPISQKSKQELFLFISSRSTKALDSTDVVGMTVQVGETQLFDQ